MTDQQQYHKGYRAGRRKGREDGIQEERAQRQLTDAEFFDEAMLRLLPDAFTVQNWTMDDRKVSTGDQRAELAARVARSAVKQRRKNRP